MNNDTLRTTIVRAKLMGVLRNPELCRVIPFHPPEREIIIEIRTVYYKRRETIRKDIFLSISLYAFHNSPQNSLWRRKE